MGFLKFLLIIFVIFYLLMLLGRFYIKRFVRKSQEKFRQQSGQNTNKQDHRSKKKGDTYVQYRPDEKKNIPKDEGEYIDYEEIK